MREHYLEFLSRAAFPEEADSYLRESINKIIPSCENELTEIVDTLYGSDFSIKATEEGRHKLSEDSGVNFYTVNFIFLCCASKRMREDFHRRNIPDIIFWDTILDLKYKLFECKQVKGVWGNFVEFWYDIFYKCNIVKLGRLEYERCYYPDEFPEFEINGVQIKHGAELVSVHIPSCGPLLAENVKESFSLAEKFFSQYHPSIKPLIFFCESWLLYEPYRKVFTDGGNMQKFMDQWNIMTSVETEQFHDFWRVYGTESDGNIDALPEDTTLRKNMKKYMQSGGNPGFGLGFRIASGCLK